MGALESIGSFTHLLKDKTLLQQAAFVGGKWVKAQNM